MEVFVKFEAYDTLIDREQIMHTRQVGGQQLQQLLESGKVRASGFFADARGAFFVLDVGSSEELFEMLAPLTDFVRIETHPVVSAEKVTEFFERDAATGI
jgi:hypothetical protein